MNQQKSKQTVLSIPEGKICDYIDSKFRDDTPEEYVRQNIEKRLVNEHKYLKSQIFVEYTLKLGSKKPRADLVIFPINCTDFIQEKVKIIIECKKESVSPTNKNEGLDQLKSYMSICPNCEWGLWTNGKVKEVFRKVINENKEIEFKGYNDIPSADGSVENIDRPKRNTLKNAVEDNLLFVFKACHNHIYANDGWPKEAAFFEFLKLIFCKIEDEKNIPNELEFYATSSEKSNPDGQLTVQKRISKIFANVVKKHPQIFDSNDKIKLTPRSLSYVVSELQKYSLLRTHIDIKGKAYEEIVGANLRGDRGEFFTPLNVMKMTVDMMEPKNNEKVLDPSCGTGGFIVAAMNKVISELESDLEKSIGKPKEEWNYDEVKMCQDRISEVASNNFFGFDINPELVKATKMNMVMNNDGSGNILRTDSLLPPHEWDEDLKTNLANVLQIKKSDIRNEKTIGFFDVIVTNPPFGSKIPIRDPHILAQYQLGHIWTKDRDIGHWSITDRLQSSVPPEQLFIERCWQFLRPGGRMGIVLPDAILGAPGIEYIRQWMIEKTYIIASIDLHEDAFQPKNGTQTSVIILQKKTQEEMDIEEKSGQRRDYNIFMAPIEKVGHDKRGYTLFKRDKFGNEILVIEREVEPLGFNSQKDSFAAETESKIKVIDDQTLSVAPIFKKWRQEEGIGW